MLTKDSLENFKRIYQEQFDITLTDEEATLMATDFLNMMKILVSPDTEEQTISNDEEIKEQPEEQTYEAKQV